MNEKRIQTMTRLLEQHLQPESLDIIDESHLHAGHEGAKGGAGHFNVIIVAEAFAGKNPVQRHRLVYGAVQEMMPQEIHALSIKAMTPEEI